jgi:hypothetical protein
MYSAAGDGPRALKGTHASKESQHSSSQPSSTACYAISKGMMILLNHITSSHR